MNPPIPVLTGPTAVGKTSLSLELAETIDAEIISADSRQVYRELTIGTAKPTQAELCRVPHHFIDERTLDQSWTAGQFAEAANARIAEILSRGHIPLVVGGSTLYLHALQYGLADIPSVPHSVRHELDTRLEREGAGALFDELLQVDPKAASTMDATKTQRLVRALEVYHHTGRPLTSYYDEQKSPRYEFVTVVLNRERQALYDRINRRVDAMLDRGLLDEVRKINAIDIERDAPPLRTIGYQEPFAYLDGSISYEEMVRLVKRNSRRYAKRQLTWFRRYDDYRWRKVKGLDAGQLSLLYNLQ